MKVKQLIAQLQKCDPEAKVEVADFEGWAELTGIEENWYATP